jgi:YD repeat-containing protein
MASGWALKAHRDIEGRKRFELHHPDGATEAVDWDAAAALIEHGLIDSNKKFPAATYWLTEAGRAAAAELSRASAAD